jgi:hypothetical protein
MTSLTIDDLEPEEAPKLTIDDLEPEQPKPKVVHNGQMSKEEGIFDPTYLIGGAAKNVTLAPSLFAMLGAAVETAGPDHLGDKGAGLPLNPMKWDWEDLKKRFGENLNEGMTKSLNDTGQEWTKSMTDTLGINEIPVRPGNQALDILGTFVTPVGSTFLGGAKATGLMGGLGKGATLLASPVRMGPKGNRLNAGFAGRAALSTGVGGAIDQTIRTHMDLPTIFGGDPTVGTIDDLEPEVATIDQLESAENSNSFNAAPDTAYLKKADQEAEAAARVQTYKEIGAGVGIALLGIAGMRYANKHRKALAGPDAFGLKDKPASNVVAETYNEVKDVVTGGKPTAKEVFDKLDPELKVAKEEASRVHDELLAAQDRGLQGDDLTPYFDALDNARQVVKDIDKQIDDAYLNQSKNQTPSLNVWGGVKKAGEIAKLRAKASIGRQVEAQRTIDDAARAAGHSTEDKIRQLDEISTVVNDVMGQVGVFIKKGELEAPKDKIIKVTKSLQETRDEFMIWPKAKQEEFLEYIAAGQSNFVRTGATADEFIEMGNDIYDTFNKRQAGIFDNIKKTLNTGSLQDTAKLMEKHKEFVTGVRGDAERIMPDLWDHSTGTKKTKVFDPELREVLRAGNANTEFSQMRKYVSENNDAILELGVQKEVFSREWADQVKRQFTVDGDLLYIPGKSSDELPSFYKRIAQNFGFMTTDGKIMRQVGNLHKQAGEELQGIGKYLDPWTASAHYATEVMEHVNRSAAQWVNIKEILGFEVDDAGDLVMPLHGTQEAAMQAAREKQFHTQVPQYIGRISHTNPDNVFGGFNLKWHDDLPKGIKGSRVGDIKKTMNTTKDAGVMQDAVNQLAALEDALIVQRKGDFYLFRVADKNLKSALEFDPRLSGLFMRFNHGSKSMLTGGTTGKFSFFSPTAFVYNGSIGSLNAAVRAEGGLLNAGKEAYQVWSDGVKGAIDIFATHTAEDFSRQLAHTLATNHGIGASNPRLLAKMQAHFAKRAKNSFVTDLERSTGTLTSSGQGGAEFKGNVTNILNSTSPYIISKYGANALPQFVRIWNHFNDAMHNGVGLGATMRRLGGEASTKTAAEKRWAKKAVADLIGNTKLQGSSQLARHLNASVPYYGAMLQALYTMGKAAHKMGLKKFTKVMAIGVGMPTAAEVAYNSMLDPDAEFDDGLGNKYTYNKWYWQKFSHEQRANNVIIMKPGMHPKDAIIFPVVPELGIFRGLAIDAMEAVFGLSGEHKFELSHASAGFNRSFNIPLPPWMKAIATGMGTNIRVGPEFNEAGDFQLYNTQSTARGNRVTSDDQVRYEGQEIDMKTVNILNDIFGSIARLVTDVYEGFNAGDEKTPISDRVEAGFDTLGRGVANQLRVGTGTLYGNHARLKMTGDRHVQTRVYETRKAVSLLAKDVAVLRSGGQRSGQTPVPGIDTKQVPLDPIARDLAFTAQHAEQQAKPYWDEISATKLKINSLRTSLYNAHGNDIVPEGRITVDQRERLIDAYASEMDNLRKQVDDVYSAAEAEFIKRMEPRVDRSLRDFTFRSYPGARPNPSSTSREPR